MRQIIGIVLIVIAIGLAYMGITEFNQSTASVEIANIELSASDGQGKTTAFIYLGLALVSFIAGTFLVAKK